MRGLRAPHYPPSLMPIDSFEYDDMVNGFPTPDGRCNMAEEVTMDTIPPCDFCNAEGSGDKPAKFDGATVGGSWAYMCSLHFTLHGLGLGTGRGQRLVERSER